ncbi:MAG: DUF4838 domain-containing protein [Armatimonadota bacterium]
MTLVAGGEPRGAICLPADPSPAERFAGDEIQTYIARITGATVPIQDSPAADGPTVFVGRQAANEPFRARIGPADPPEEGLIVACEGRSVHLVGTGDRGTVYAAYSFLESELGCRWYMPGEIGEQLPRARTVAVAELQRIETPSFRFRRGIDFTPQWGVRQRANVGDPQFGEQVGGLYEHYGGHIYHELVPTEQYMPEHPEYFCLIRGRRMRNANHAGQLCTSNPEVINIAARRIIDYFRTHPDCTVHSLMPNDGMGRWCQCQRCQRMMQQLGSDARVVSDLKQVPVVSDRVVLFSNRVAEQVAREFPDRYLAILAYADYTKPPLVVKPHPNLIIYLCRYRPACYVHPLGGEVECPKNREYTEILDNWLELSDNIGVYTYVYTGASQFLPWPYARRFARDLVFYRDRGVRDLMHQSNYQAYGQLPLTYYLMAKFSWNADQDLEAVIDEFYEGFYGPAAQPLRAMDDYMHAACLERAGHVDHGYYNPRNIFTREFLTTCREHLDEAMRLTGDDQILRRRVGMRSAWFRYVELYMDMLLLPHELPNDPEHLEASTRRLEEVHDELVAHIDGLEAQQDPVIQARRARNVIPTVEEAVAELQWPMVPQELPIVWHIADFEEARRSGIRPGGFAEPEEKGGVRCRNTDETGLGDKGWAQWKIALEDVSRPVELTLTVWGESDFGGLVLYNGSDWPTIETHQTSGEPRWETYRVVIAPQQWNPYDQVQMFGVGGRQIWLGELRLRYR